jgi:hypothetical protein
MSTCLSCAMKLQCWVVGSLASLGAERPSVARRTVSTSPQGPMACQDRDAGHAAALAPRTGGTTLDLSEPSGTPWRLATNSSHDTQACCAAGSRKPDPGPPTNPWGDHRARLQGVARNPPDLSVRRIQFLQEDRGVELADVVIRWAQSPTRPGSTYATCIPAGRPAFDRVFLSAFNALVANAIREAEPNHLVFAAPNALFNDGVPHLRRARTVSR